MGAQNSHKQWTFNNAKVVTYSMAAGCGDACDHQQSHETVTRGRIAEKIAALMACDYGGEYNATGNYDGIALYFVPNDTLLVPQARALGIGNTTQLFGGCVPFPFVATKSISHDLIGSDASAPPGWTAQFSAAVNEITLRGYSAFCKPDAYIAAERLLRYGEVRIKAAFESGGGGQSIVTTFNAAKAAIDAIDEDDCTQCGIVLETNLSDVTTRSIGTVCIGATQFSYCGTQFMTQNANGQAVYGGSSLRTARGDLTALLQLQWSTEEQLAIAQAISYDRAALNNFAGFFASRRNYDVAQGFDRNNNFCSGVLEQSWRIGGASPAEIAAVEALIDNKDLVSVRASCREVHAICNVPSHATTYFRGVDARVGAITKFALIDAYEY